MCSVIDVKNVVKTSVQEIDGNLFQRQLTKSYKKHSMNGLMRYILEVKQHMLRCLVYIVFICFIEIFSTKLSLKLANLIGLRRGKL